MGVLYVYVGILCTPCAHANKDIVMRAGT
jgi:hypothetical protein